MRRKVKVDEFYSDRSRIIYSSSFRRLQQKAQVFSLEPNASVRTRMTHSLEVSDLGRTLANKIAQSLFNQKLVSLREIPLIVAVVENACLLHDIGNPPFGHFGEFAIREWS
ncbi:MAG: HD domain-containing protein, partial [Sedimentibacter sp.]